MTHSRCSSDHEEEGFGEWRFGAERTMKEGEDWGERV